MRRKYSSTSTRGANEFAAIVAKMSASRSDRAFQLIVEIKQVLSVLLLIFDNMLKNSHAEMDALIMPTKSRDEMAPYVSSLRKGPC